MNTPLNLYALVACSQNGVIGWQGNLPWKKIQVDLKFFKNKTYGMPILMGRKTFNSIHNKPLPGRPNIILSRQKVPKIATTIWLNSLSQVQNYCQQFNYKELYIVGGAEIYNLCFPFIKIIYFTKIFADFEGDAFCKIPSYFKRTTHQLILPNNKTPYKIAFESWTNTVLQQLTDV